MSYGLKEIFLSLQGEGAQSGRLAIFARFTGCNLWSGREADRATAVCRFCDTDFVGTYGVNGGRYEAAGLAAKCAELWGVERTHRYVVLTGGEPTLQIDGVLLDALHRFGFAVAIETNGTRPCPDGLDWITISPKAGTHLVQTTGDECKVVYPQAVEPGQYAGLAFRHFFVQPKWVDDEAERAVHVQAAARYCLENPPWRLSVQMHKSIGLP